VFVRFLVEQLDFSEVGIDQDGSWLDKLPARDGRRA
jgi:hypothetical protein